MALFAPIFRALNEAGARYVVVGGLATVLHGYARLTADIDLIVDLEEVEVRKVLAALSALGFRPRAPLDLAAFTVQQNRREWIDQKNMRVLSLYDPRDPMREVDLFVESPVPFAELFERSEVVAAAGTNIRVASIPDLIFLKRLAGRREDVQDIEALEAILEKRRA